MMEDDRCRECDCELRRGEMGNATTPTVCDDCESKRISKVIADAVAEERETCAAIADKIGVITIRYPSPDVARDDGARIAAKKIAELIRERKSDE